MKKELIFLPHAQHFILSDKCKFRLATYTNGFIISTVGELNNGGKEFEELGINRLYETYVFKARRSKKNADCCLYEVTDWSEIDGNAYNDSKSAREGHMEMCKKYQS